jgi:uncharacterized protein YbbK (DUF523 family)
MDMTVRFPMTEGDIATLPQFTADSPIRILFSACLLGSACGVDGTSYGEQPMLLRLARLPNVKPVTFCPEDVSFGTPRNMPDIHGGDGFDVIDGRARVLTDKGEDWTDGMIAAAHKMLHLAQGNCIDLAILMDMSAACGTQIISDGPRLVENRRYRKGPGVCSALLMRNGFRVIAQRDYRYLHCLMAKLDKTHVPDAAARNHDETEWYRGYFAAG